MKNFKIIFSLFRILPMGLFPEWDKKDVLASKLSHNVHKISETYLHKYVNYIDKQITF